MLRSKSLAVLAALVLVPCVWAGPSANALFRKGSAAQRQGRHIEALLLYNRARALDPGNAEYVRAAHSVRRGAAQLLAAAGRYQTALALAPDSWEFRSLSETGEETAPAATITVNRDGPQPRQPATLRYARHETEFRFRDSILQAYEEVAQEFGVHAIFAEDFEGDVSIRADLSECGFRCAMRILGALGKSIAVPLSDDEFLVVPGTAPSRAAYETVALATIPLDGALGPEGAAEIVQAIQQALDVRRLQTGTTAGAILLRDTVAKINLARSLAGDLSRPSAAVVIELRMISVSSGRTAGAGIDLPSTFPMTNFSTLFGAMPDAAGVERLIGIGGGETVLGVALGNASALARLDASSSQTLQQLSVRSLHGMAAEFNIGERYPIATAQYSSGAPTPQSPSYVQPPPSVTFEDLGLNLAATPTVHSATEVTLSLDVNFRLLAGGAVNDVPILSNREFQSQVRLRQGEFAIVSGMQIYERSLTRGGLAGLGQIPLLGAIFRRNEWRWSRRDLLALVTPRIVRLPPAELAGSRSLLFGPEDGPIPTL
ncbi:MAG: hypothetical protein F4X77_05005 [Acidobacteriia bacterium]|nr:hypothetical protein [Terriglobia bacterium]